MVDITIVFMGFINQLITGGHHPVSLNRHTVTKCHDFCSMMFPCYSHDFRMKKPRMLASSASKWTLSTLGGSDTVSAQATTGGCSGEKPWLQMLQWVFQGDRMQNSSNSQYWYIIKKNIYWYIIGIYRSPNGVMIFHVDRHADHLHKFNGAAVTMQTMATYTLWWTNIAMENGHL